MLSRPYPLYDPVSGTRDPLIAVTVFAVLDLITSTMRFVSRKIKRVPFGLDDWCILVAQVRMMSSR